MHIAYTFDFLGTVSKQLVDKLDSLGVTALTGGALDDLAAFQGDTGCAQGVYLIHEGAHPRYLGKADGVADRLAQHLRKLTGRRNIHLADVGYKAVLLDASMSTAANEELLIRLYSEAHAGMWNGKGFGPKDPGRKRDTTDASVFDREHPIITDFAVNGVDDNQTLGSLFRAMKDGLPYVFRYEVGEAADLPINLAGVPRNAEALLRAAMHILPGGWHGAILAYGMVVYPLAPRDYPAGVVVIEGGI